MVHADFFARISKFASKQQEKYMKNLCFFSEGTHRTPALIRALRVTMRGGSQDRRIPPSVLD